MTTATDIQQGTRRTISGTVQNPREDGHGHYLIDLQGTGWTQDKFSVTAFEVAGQETLAALPVGRHIEVVVEAQQKREGKDGSRERDWYWRIVGPSNGATPAAEPAPAPQDAANATRRPNGHLQVWNAERESPRWECIKGCDGPGHMQPGNEAAAYETRKAAALAPDPRGNSIERQVALKAAVDLASNGLLVPEEGKGLLDTIEGAANRFIGWLQGTTAPDTEPGHLVRAAQAMGAGEPEPQIDESQAPTDVDGLPF